MILRYPSGHLWLWINGNIKLIINMYVDLHGWSLNDILWNVAIWKYSVDLWQAKNKQRSIRYCVRLFWNILPLYLAYRNLVDWPWTSSFGIDIYLILHSTHMFRLWHLWKLQSGSNMVWPFFLHFLSSTAVDGWLVELHTSAGLDYPKDVQWADWPIWYRARKTIWTIQIQNTERHIEL